ncbi:MAG: LytTR family DNA-binding domain-containing protein [Asticcacaulis sp.]|uniref:LytTR family DNA-binding domain-containing protein n=1 Tax=Asticcacaulis sp. TaxID=1872648 RepID=UPI003F7BC003
MTDAAVRASPVAWILQRFGTRWPRTYGVAALIGVLLAFTGAMGTGEAGMATRLAYWLILMLGGTGIANLTGALFDRLNLPLWPQIALMLIVITPLIATYAWGVTGLFGGGRFEAARWPAFVLPSFVIALAVAVLHTQINRVPAQSHAFAPDAASVEPGAVFRERLPFKHRHADIYIYALAAEDHYLRVFTSAGETLILMRLYDAIRELDGIEGSQTHRSWWVAKAAVTDAARGDGKATLTLKNGVAAPVSRSYVKALKADGWL